MKSDASEDEAEFENMSEQRVCYVFIDWNPPANGFKQLVLQPGEVAAVEFGPATAIVCHSHRGPLNKCAGGGETAKRGDYFQFEEQD